MWVCAGFSVCTDSTFCVPFRLCTGVSVCTEGFAVVWVFGAVVVSGFPAAGADAEGAVFSALCVGFCGAVCSCVEAVRRASRIFC